MSLNIYNFSLRGLADWVMFGKTGPKLKKTVTNELEVRNNADAAYINLRAASPIIADDVATKLYVDSFPGLLRAARGTVLFNDVSPANIDSALPAANVRINRVIVRVDVAFDDVAATIEIGRASDPNELVAIGDFWLDQVGVYMIDTAVDWVGSEQIIATISPGAATQGSATIECLYTTA